MKRGIYVCMSEDLKRQFRRNDSVEHVEEFGDCIGIVEGPVDWGTCQGPEVDVRWYPSRLRYAYHPDNLEVVMLLHERLFPQLRKAKWGQININELAVDVHRLLGPLFEKAGLDNNPFLDPEVCEQWKEFIHKVKGIDYSWGGYMEDRGVVWKGHYHDPGATMHVGVDYYVPVNTPVMLPVDGCKLVDCLADPDQWGGWGGKLLFEWAKGYFILAHLKDMVSQVGKVYRLGEQVAVIAEPEKNGGWSPHLHVQCITKTGSEIEDGLNYALSVDGYLRPYDNIEKDFPDPTLHLW